MGVLKKKHGKRMNPIKFSLTYPLEPLGALGSPWELLCYCATVLSVPTVLYGYNTGHQVPFFLPCQLYSRPPPILASLHSPSNGWPTRVLEWSSGPVVPETARKRKEERKNV